MVFTDFLQTVKVFSANFISAILSVHIWIKVVFILVKSKLQK